MHRRKRTVSRRVRSSVKSARKPVAKTRSSSSTTSGSSVREIVVVNGGWVLLGDVTRVESGLQVTNGSVIRRWGTKEGLGQLVSSGRQSETIIDPLNGDTFIPWSAVLFTVKVSHASTPSAAHPGKNGWVI